MINTRYPILEELPSDIWLVLMRYFDVNDVRSLLFTSKKINNVFYNDCIWKVLITDNHTNLFLHCPENRSEIETYRYVYSHYVETLLMILNVHKKVSLYSIPYPDDWRVFDEQINK